MLVLLVDTSQEISYLALFQQGNSPQLCKFQEKTQSAFLLSKIDELLSANSKSLSDLTLIIVCNGPGSFTGTRIGVMTVKALAFAKEIPLAHYNSLIPYSLPNHLTLLPAKRNECFILDPEDQPILTTYDKVISSQQPIATPCPELIQALLPSTKLVKTFFDSDLVLTEVLRKGEGKTINQAKSLDVCYLRSPIKK